MKRGKVAANGRLYSGAVLVLGVNQLIESIAYSIPFSYFPHYAISLGASVASIGLFTSSFMLMSAVMSPVLGGLSDRVGRKKLMLLGLVGDVIFGALTGLVPSWEWLLLVRTINGAVTAAAILSAEALLIDVAPEDRRGEATGFVMACGMIGRSIGPAFGGFIQWLSKSSGLSLLGSYRVPYFVDAALAALCVFLIAWKIKEDRAKIVEKQDRKTRKWKVEIPSPFKILLVCAIVNGFSIGFAMPVAVLLFGDKFGVQPVEIGLTISIAGFIGLFANWMAGKISDRVGRKPVIALGGFSARLAGITVPFTFNFNQASLLIVVMRMSMGLNGLGMRALRADLSPSKVRGRLFGLYQTFSNIGMILGPLIGTYLYSIYRFKTLRVGNFLIPGLGMPFFVAALLGLTATAILLIFVREPERVVRR